MNLRIDSPGKNSVFVDSLPHLYYFVYLDFRSLVYEEQPALWNRHVKLRPPMFAAKVAGGRTEINA